MAPPSPAGPPGGTGAAMMPGKMAGTAAQGHNLVRGALEMLQKALPTLELGGELHNAALKAVSELSKHIGNVAGAGDPAAVVQMLAQAARAAQQAPVPPALGGGGGGGGAPPPGPAAPPMAA